MDVYVNTWDVHNCEDRLICVKVNLIVRHIGIYSLKANMYVWQRLFTTSGTAWTGKN